MPTLSGNTFSGFTRPSDPIASDQIAVKISTDIAKTVTVVVTPTDVLVTGLTLVTGDGTPIQTSISSYNYVPLQFPLNAAMYADDDSTMAANAGTRVPTQRAVKAADTTVAGLIGKLQTSAGIVYGAWPYPFIATTNSSGIATVYLTSDGTSGGTIAFNTVYTQSASPVPIGSASNYQVVSTVVSGDLKTLTVNVNQLGSVVLGLVNVTSAASGVVIQGTVWGK